MNRRKFIGTVGSIAILPLAGCTRSPPPSDNVYHTSEVEEINGNTVHMHVESQYACKGMYDFPKTISIRIMLLGDGETLYEDVWEYDPGECMVPHSTTRIHTYDGEYETIKLDTAVENIE